MPHSIQRSILSKLMTSPVGWRYRDMNVGAIENDRYNYHLQYLVQQGLIEKRSNRYLLSESGKRFVLNQQPIDILGQESDLFKLAALALVLRRKGSQLEVLYQTRLCQPFIGNQELIGGAIRKGEFIVEAAKRRLYEEANLVADFSLFGLVRKLRFDSGGQLYSDILYHICLAFDPTGELCHHNEFGRNAWLPIDAVILHEQTAPYGSQQFAMVLQQLKQKSAQAIPLFYYEATYRQDIY